MKTSKLREDAAHLLRSLGLDVRGNEIRCVSGFWKHEDCYRFEFMCRKTGVNYGCWLTLTDFVKECKKYGGATFSNDGDNVYPAYPEDDKDSACPLCGQDGGATCGMPNCQY